MEKTKKFKQIDVSAMGTFWNFQKDKIFLGKYVSEHTIDSVLKTKVKGKPAKQNVYEFEQYDNNGNPLGITFALGGNYSIDAFLNSPFGNSKKALKVQGHILRFEFIEQKRIKGGKKINVFKTSVLLPE